MKNIFLTLMVFGIVGCDVKDSDYWVCDGYSRNAYDDAYYLERHVVNFTTGEMKRWSDMYDFWNNPEDQCADPTLYGEKLNECILQKRGYFVEYSDDYVLQEVSKVSESTVYIRFNIIDAEGGTNLEFLKLENENKLRATYNHNIQADSGRWATKNFCSKNIPITWKKQNL
ncbi:hypothetical protein N9Y72_03370 [Gammaproteobacteria bacterium]|nr:hypothetical protein [Gammaproteobacteria bacterium]